MPDARKPGDVHPLFGLMSYAPDHQDLTQRAAVYIEKILKGAEPADLPVAQASGTSWS